MNLDGTTALDQPIPKPLVIDENGNRQEKYEEDYVLDLADRVIGEALEEGDFSIAFMAIEKFRAMNKASSLGNCKLLHDIEKNWNKVPHKENKSFIEEAMRNTGYSQPTIERYVAVWKYLNNKYIPEQFLDNIWHQTMRCLVKEASLIVDQGYDLEDDEWLALSEAVDEHAVAEVVAKVKGRPRSKNHMSLKIDSEGDVWLHQGGNSTFYFSLPIRDQREYVQKANRRTINELGITKRNEY